MILVRWGWRADTVWPCGQAGLRIFTKWSRKVSRHVCQFTVALVWDCQQTHRLRVRVREKVSEDIENMVVLWIPAHILGSRHPHEVCKWIFPLSKALHYSKFHCSGQDIDCVILLVRFGLWQKIIYLTLSISLVPSLVNCLTSIWSMLGLKHHLKHVLSSKIHIFGQIWAQTYILYQEVNT